MPKSLEDIKATLEAAEAGTELMEGLTAIIAKSKSDMDTAVAAEKSRGISEVNKKNREAEGLRKFKKGLVDVLGFDSEADDLDDFLDGVKTKTEKGGNGNGGGSSEEVKALEKKMKKMEQERERDKTELQVEKDKANAMKVKQNNTYMRGFVLDKLKDDKGEFKVYGPEILADNFIATNKIKLDDDGKRVFFPDGESEIEFDDGMKSFLEKNKGIIKNSQTGGGGSSGGGGSGDTTKLTLKERKDRLKKLSNKGSI